MLSTIRNFRAGIGRIYRALFYGSNGTLSMGRVLVLIGVLQIALAFWLFVIWIGYVTATGQMEQAAPLAMAIGTVLTGVLSSQVAAVTVTWWTTKKYTDAGSATQAQVNDPQATVGASVVPPPPPVPIVQVPVTEAGAIAVDIVSPSDPNNPGGI